MKFKRFSKSLRRMYPRAAPDVPDEEIDRVTRSAEGECVMCSMRENEKGDHLIILDHLSHKREMCLRCFSTIYRTGDCVPSWLEDL